MVKIYVFLLGAVVLDLILGDPRWLVHPVVIIGRLISWLESRLRNNGAEKKTAKASGLLLVGIVLVGTYLSTRLIVAGGYFIHPLIGHLLYLWLVQTTLAIKGLTRSGRVINRFLEQGQLKSARAAVDMIVGRDCDQLSEEGVIRATVETLAENTSDGIIAPLFYYLIGGLPLAMVYKAVNTLDSMLGYKNEKYQYFGWASARLDDLANFIPARLTGLFLSISAVFVGLNCSQAVKIMLRDAGKHPSLNAGFPEAAVAGALGVRLGGANFYQGEYNFRDYLGDASTVLSNDDINQVISMIYWSVFLFSSLSLLFIRTF